MKSSIEEERDRLREDRDNQRETIIKYQERVSELEKVVDWKTDAVEDYGLRVHKLECECNRHQARIRELEAKGGSDLYQTLYHLRERVRDLEENLATCMSTSIEESNSLHAHVKELEAEKTKLSEWIDNQPAGANWDTIGDLRKDAERLRRRNKELESLIARCTDWFEGHLAQIERVEALNVLLEALRR